MSVRGNAVGIESDQLVYDYLSRVGDLAQQRHLPSGTRRELVAGLRDEIDRQRARATGDSPAAVRRILGRIGTPDEVVTAAGTTPAAPSAGATPTAPPAGATPVPPPTPAVPRPTPQSPPEPGPGQRSAAQWMRSRIPGPRKAAPPAPVPPLPAAPPAPAAPPPHLAGLDQLGGTGQDDDTDWWNVTPQPFGVGEQVAGFTGGVEIPEILAPPRPDDPEDGDEDEGEDGNERGGGGGADGHGLAGLSVDKEAAADAGRGPGRARRLLTAALLRRRAAPGPVEDAPAEETAAAPVPRLGAVVLLLAAVLLVAGAALASWIALGLGWLLAWGLCGLSPAERRFAVLGLPGTAAAVALVWLWGREDGRWGDPLPPGSMADALSAAAPWTIKGAALASALFLLWRARRT
ncbi:hypothetical protein LL058_15975 [Streptomyces clavuligerus]|uniref:hypothetical protein n=1 Tax=Streptomyces clavuligerus TaxID=1901 RepID=UPI001F4553C5|nr:hypothetical protein [Streptomyces clavuligerus]WDN53219.1 hypothetical protein LL058_15975 [Streptomyces clavuligerus]